MQNTTKEAFNSKQNQLINSRLEQSIQPFATIRQQMIGASKFNQSRFRSKHKKGISRVNSLEPVRNPRQQSKYCEKSPMPGIVPTINKKEQRIHSEYSKPIEPPLSMSHKDNYQSHKKQRLYSSSSNLKVVRQRTQEQEEQNRKSIGPTYITTMNQRTAQPTQFVFSNKLKSLQSQVTILQQTNQQQQRQLQKWKYDFRQLELDNSEINRKYRDRQSEIYREREDKLKELEKNRNLLQQLSNSQSQKEKLQSMVRKLESANTTSSELNKINSELEKQQHDVKQKYRQLLIKSSMVEQQKDNLARKIGYYTEMATKLQEQNKNLASDLQQLEVSNYQLKQKAKLVDQYYKDLQALYYVKHQYQQAKVTIEVLQVKLKEYQKMRADQTTQHFQQLKRFETKTQKQIQQDQFLIRELKQKTKNTEESNRSLRDRLEEAEYEIERFKSKHQVYEGNSKEYQNILKEQQMEMIQKLQTKQNLIYELKNDYESLIAEMRKQIQELQFKNKTMSSQMQILKKECQSKLKAETQLEEGWIKLGSASGSKNKNSNLSNKIEEYLQKIEGLQNKIHLCQLQSQRAKNKSQSYQRKIDHLEQQLKIVEKDKEDMLNEKIKITEELAEYRAQLKNKEVQSADLYASLGNIQEQLKKHQILLVQDEQRIKKLTDLNLDLEDQCKILEKRCEKNNTMIQEYQLELQKHMEMKEKYKKQINSGTAYEQENKQLINQLQELRKQKQLYQQQSEEKDKYLQNICNIIQIKYPRESLETVKIKLERYVIAQKQCNEKILHLEKVNTELQATNKAYLSTSESYKSRCSELERILMRTQDDHKQKLVLVKEDYDIVYAKYMKYRNMALQCKNKNCHHRNEKMI